jgi:hypothetical protein
LIEEEIAYNYEKFKTTHYHFLDDTVNEDPDKVKNLSMIPKHTGVDIKWNGYLRLDLLSRYPDTPGQLKDSGMQSCFFGVETFHRESSRKIGKGWNGRAAKEFLPKLHKEIWKSDINIWANFIIGLPGESKDDIEETFKWCLENPIGSYRFVTLNLYKNRTDSGTVSEFNRNYQSYGYKLDDNNFWENNFMTQREADEIAKQYNTILTSHNKLSSWSLFDAVSSGIDLQHAKHLSPTAVNPKFFITNILIPYKDKLRNL